jgi:hypothetical protein
MVLKFSPMKRPGIRLIWDWNKVGFMKKIRVVKNPADLVHPAKPG